MPRGAPNRQSRPDEAQAQPDEAQAQTTQSQGNTPLSGHRNYAEYKAEHEKLHPGVAALSESVWSNGSSGEASTSGSGGTNTAEDTRGQTTFRVTGSMTEIGTTEAGRTGRLDLSGVSAVGEGAVVLYDDATGKLYQTTEWSDVKRNGNYIVDRGTGNRQRIAGYATYAGEEEGYSIQGHSQPGAMWVLAGYEEEIPEAGTEEFQEYVSSKFEAAVIGQLRQNQYSVDEDGHLKKPGTDLGQWASISASDYIKLGRPGKVGNMSMSKYAEMSDEQLLAEGVLYSQDTKRRSHGLEKTLNKIGGNLGTNTFRVIRDLGKIPIAGDLNLLTHAVKINDAYSQAREMGQGTSRALHQAGKQGIISYAEMNIAALKTAIIAGTTVATGGATTPLAVSVLAGAAAGAATEFGGAMANYGVTRAVTGARLGGTSNAIEAAGKASAVGAITGAVSAGAARVLGPGVNLSRGLNPATAAQEFLGPGSFSRIASSTVRGAASYGANRMVYGSDALGSHDSQLFSALMTGLQSNSYDAETYAGTNATMTPPADGFSWSAAVNGFRNHLSGSSSLSVRLSPVRALGFGSNTDQVRRAAHSVVSEKPEDAATAYLSNPAFRAQYRRFAAENPEYPSAANGWQYGLPPSRYY